jgi:hypothetical protein
VPFVPAANLDEFCAACNQRLDAGERTSWIMQVLDVPLLNHEMGSMAETFERFELQRPTA